MAVRDFYEEVAEKFIEKLKEGTAPWQRNWDAGAGMMPLNPTTGNRYRGINVLILMAQDRDDSRWMTYRQAQKIGAQVRKGETGTPVIYWKTHEEQPLKDNQGKVRLGEDGKPLKVLVELERPRAFLSRVFNAEQIDGLPPLIKTDRQWNPVDRAEALLKQSGATIQHRAQPRAFYSPHKDVITLPEKGQFFDANGYYAAALHELGHWTGHESRLNRDMQHPWGSQGYAREELRAEIASMMLGQEIGLGHGIENHVAYVGSWINALKEDPHEIFSAASDAEKIMNYVLGLELKQEIKQEHSANKEEAPSVSIGSEDAKPLSVVVSHDDSLDSRRYLDVPYREKNAVKELGAKWDRQDRSWYIPAGMDQAPFKKWLEKKEDEENNRAISARLPPEREYLAVPYGERKEAKALGAKWDTVERSWYVGEAADRKKLEKWLPDRQRVEQAPAVHPQEEFSEVLRDIGCVVEGEHPIMDGNRHRIATTEDRPGEQAGFYVAFLDGRPAGYVKNNRSGEEIRWTSSGSILTAAERETLKNGYRERQEEKAVALSALHEASAKRIQTQLDGLHPVSEVTPYMVAKGIRPHAGAYLGADGKTTCLPAQDVDGKVWTMQYIREDGTKRFAKDCRKTGCFHPVGGMEALKQTPVLVIAEGYATAASLTEALGFATVAAFDSGNLQSVATALHERYPEKPVVIAGDDDRHLVEKIGKNPGREKAEKAAQEVGGEVVFPLFAPGEREAAPSGFTDFNDLAQKSCLGQEGVARQVQPIVERAAAKKEQKRELARTQRQSQALSR
ncbi:MAG: zincin-like metallopeptidase domain-containing protein [Bilophila wadsworthia]|uniref:zincin-like metallopeptidase domain-containing protein n=1 Tax=Bilophila wadsworthia TaxID=35833 RepID=UPI00291258B4|nr:zincin-like metallopeptidase domain-containing protein [Bilophila wadsworthia]MDU4375124.1 zincin-like metallopeptidase domain-containing protein [Bilophila wadsworthia]